MGFFSDFFSCFFCLFRKSVNFFFQNFYSECTCILKVEHGNVLFFLICVNMEIFFLFFLFTFLPNVLFCFS